MPESARVSPIVSSRRRRAMPRSALRQSDLFADAPYKSDIWSERLLAAFADANLRSGFLPLAEQAIEACPGDAIILILAATAALLDERPERALVFLKRFSKRASAPAETSLACAGAQPTQQTGRSQGAVGEQWPDQPAGRRQGLSGRVRAPAVVDPATR